MIDKARVLILPGLGNSGPEHWQSCWERSDVGCQRVLQQDWNTPQCSDWVAQLDSALSSQHEPVCLAAHSSACALIAHWTLIATPDRLAQVKGALLVAPSDPENPNYPVGPHGFGPVPLVRFHFASIVVASSDDRYIEPSKAKRYAAAWGSRFVLMQDAGHINADSGFGAWPEGFALLDSLR